MAIFITLKTIILGFRKVLSISIAKPDECAESCCIQGTSFPTIISTNLSSYIDFQLTIESTSLG